MKPWMVILLGVLIAGVPILPSILSEGEATEQPQGCEVSDQRMTDAEMKINDLQEAVDVLRAIRGEQ